MVESRFRVVIEWKIVYNEYNLFFTQERSRLMWDNKVLKQKAKERMKVNYWKML